MIRLYKIVVLAVAFFFVLPLSAQRTNRRSPQLSRGERPSQEASGVAEPSVRAQLLNERLTQEVGNARWMRTIYRELDLMREENAPLYYPTRPANGQMNLFSVIFQLLGEQKIKAYEYLDGYELFDADHEVRFKELLERFHILHEEVPGRAGAEPTFVIHESDVPAEEVRSYYVKEAWYFDQNSSAFDVKILAICPILTSAGDLGETTMPMFWLPYEQIRPYICQSYIMTSSVNNAKTFTVDDFFRRRMFVGEIVKTQNLLNRPLRAYCPTPDSLEREQQRIEGQLADFEKALWYTPDSSLFVKEKRAERRESKKGERKQPAQRKTVVYSVRPR